jgi:hypothetical protein
MSSHAASEGLCNIAAGQLGGPGTLPLAQHHPGGGLNRLLLEKGLAIQPLLTGGTGFLPQLLGFPAEAMGQLSYRKAFR